MLKSGSLKETVPNNADGKTFIGSGETLRLSAGLKRRSEKIILY